MSSTPRGRPRKLHAVPSLDLSRVPPDSASPVAAAGASKTNAQNAKGKQGGPLGPSADNGRFETPRGRAVPSAAAAPSGSADTKSNLLIVGAILVALAAVWYTQQTPATGPTSQVSDATTSPPKAEPSPSTASASQQGPSATASKPPAPAPSTPPSTAPANAASAPKVK